MLLPRWLVSRKKRDTALYISSAKHRVSTAGIARVRVAAEARWAGVRQLKTTVLEVLSVVQKARDLPILVFGPV